MEVLTTARRSRWLITGTAVAGFAACSMAGLAPAAASPYTEVPSAFDGTDKFDLFLRLDYDWEIRSAAVKREFAGLPGTQPGDPLPVAKDLLFSGSRHTLTPRLEMGLLKDLSITGALPIVLRDTRSLEYDQRESSCIFPGTGQSPTCINAENSSTVRDGIVPATGFDANDPTAPLSGRTLFRGPARSGLDQLHVGLSWAPMNQERDEWKPTWKLNAELRLPIGNTMRFDRAAPSSETGVGRGVTEVHLSTSIARRVGRAEPYFELWWTTPVSTQDESQFVDFGFGQTTKSPQQHAGTHFGFEATLWENEPDNQRMILDLSGTLEALFEGRDYTEMWEVFAFAGTAAEGGPLVLDADPLASGAQAMSHPGVTVVQNYLRFAGRAAVGAELGQNVRMNASFQLRYDQSHFISFADAGSDGDDMNDVVNPGTAEVNPMYVPLIDQAGRRYIIDDAFNYTIGLEARILF